MRDNTAFEIGTMFEKIGSNPNSSIVERDVYILVNISENLYCLVSLSCGAKLSSPFTIPLNQPRVLGRDILSHASYFIDSGYQIVALRDCELHYRVVPEEYDPPKEMMRVGRNYG